MLNNSSNFSAVWDFSRLFGVSRSMNHHNCGRAEAEQIVVLTRNQSSPFLFVLSEAVVSCMLCKFHQTCSTSYNVFSGMCLLLLALFHHHHCDICSLSSATHLLDSSHSMIWTLRLWCQYIMLYTLFSSQTSPLWSHRRSTTYVLLI